MRKKLGYQNFRDLQVASLFFKKTEVVSCYLDKKDVALGAVLKQIANYRMIFEDEHDFFSFIKIFHELDCLQKDMLFEQKTDELENSYKHYEDRQKRARVIETAVYFDRNFISKPQEQDKVKEYISLDSAIDELNNKVSLDLRRTRQVIANATDIRTGHNLIAHVSDSSRLSRILTQGILSYEFVKRAPDNVAAIVPIIYPKMQKEYGLNKISFFDGDLKNTDTFTEDMFEIAKNARFKNPFIIISDKKRYKFDRRVASKNPSDGWEGEVLFKDRLASRFFTGLVLPDDFKFSDESLDALIQLEQKSKELVLIYNVKGDLKWPRQIKYEDIKIYAKMSITKS